MSTAAPTSRLKLEVVEAVQADVGRGVVRIHRDDLARLGLQGDDGIVEIHGERITAGIAVPAYPGDAAGIVRMDGLLRANAKASVGDCVEIARAKVQPARRVTVAPARAGVRLEGPAEGLRGTLLDRPVTAGDIISTAIYHGPPEPSAEEARAGGTGRSGDAGDGAEGYFERFLGVPAFALGELRLLVIHTRPRGIVQITEETDVEVLRELPESKEPRETAVTWEDVGGCAPVIRRIREVVELPLRYPELFDRLGIDPPRGVILHGPPGTGKTLLARAVAHECDAWFRAVSGPEVVGKYYGESEQRLRKLFEEAADHAPSIIFIDEIDAIAPRRETASGETERRIVAQLLTLMDGLQGRRRVIVLAATNRLDAVDTALRRPGRFDREIELAAPDETGRLEILDIHTRAMPLAADVDFAALARRTVGYTGSDLAALCREAALHAVQRWLPTVDRANPDAVRQALFDLVVTGQDFDDALDEVMPSAMREVAVRVPDVEWADIGGLEEVKQKLREFIEWPMRHPDAFRRLGLRPPRGVLLYGPPGTGKTMLARAVARAAEANFIAVKGSDVLSKWYGESEQRVAEIFRRARAVAPTILFFDEIDSLLPARGSGVGEPQVTNRVVNQFLAEMDGIEPLAGVTVLGASNRPDVLDPAVLRPGRFDEVVYVPVPDREGRRAILATCVRKLSLTDSVDLDALAARTEGFSGADLAALCNKAALWALREYGAEARGVEPHHFDRALEEVTPSITDDVEHYYRHLRQRMQRADRALGFRP